MTTLSKSPAPSKNAGGKSADEVREMFSRVSRRYDFLNHLLSLGLDITWRKRAAREARGLGRGDLIVDLCTGTGDLAFALHRVAPEARIIALDFTPEMVAFGLRKAARLAGRDARPTILFGIGDALKVPVRDNSAAIASVAFGIRNVTDLDGALREMRRVLRPGGTALILEFTKPSGLIFGRLYMFYFRYILPLIGRVIAAAAGDAYKYLPRSVQAFAGAEEMSARMAAIGFCNVRAIPLTFGTVHLYCAMKSR